MSKRAEADKIVEDVVKAMASERKRQDLSLRALALKAGVTQPGIGYLEDGSKKPTLHYLLQLSNALGIELWKLLKAAETRK